MTSNMAFECLLVSRDHELFKMMDHALRDLSISTNACVNPSRAPDALRKGTTDLIVVDCALEGARELLLKMCNVADNRKPTVLAISPQEPLPATAHIVLKSPVTADSAREALKRAYSRMLLDYRRHVRYALMMPVVATFQDGRTAGVTITDIGDGGVGALTCDPIEAGDTFSFLVWLPGTVRQIILTVRVLWTLGRGRAGCEFLRIPPVDLMILHDWLKSRVRIKKPRIELK